MGNVNVVFKSGAWYTIGNFILKGMAFVTMPIFTRLMTKKEYGDFDYLFTLTTLLSFVVSLHLYTSVNRARIDFKGCLNDYCSSILCAGIVSTIFLYILVVLNMSFFSELFSLSPFYIHFIFAYLLLQPAMDIFQIKQRVTYKYKLSILISLLSSFLAAFFSIVLVFNLEDRFFARTIGYFIPMDCICLGLFVYFFKTSSTIKWKYIRYALVYSWPFIIHALSAYILASSDKIIIGNLLGREEIAVYSVAVSCSSIAMILMTSINSAISPWIFDELEKGNYECLRKFLFIIPLIFLFLIQSVLLIAPEILVIVGGHKYMDALPCIFPLILAVFVQFCYCLYACIEQYSKKNWAIALGTPIAALVNIVLNYFLIPQYGYIAAAYTTLISYVILFLIHFIFVRKIGFANVLDDKKMLLLVLCSSFILMIIPFVHKGIFLRYGIFIGEFVLVFIIVVKNRSAILNSNQSIKNYCKSVRRKCKLFLEKMYVKFHPCEDIDIRELFESEQMSKYHHPLVAIRYTAVVDFFESNDVKFDFYRHVYARSLLSEKNLDKDVANYIELIKSIKTNGYQNTPLIIDQCGNVRNGTHRLAICIYLGYSKIRVCRRNFQNSELLSEKNSMEFLKLSESDVLKIRQAYHDIYHRLNNM